jgi:alpha-L-arabinofuranosidase
MKLANLRHLVGLIIVSWGVIAANAAGGDPPVATIQVNLKEQKVPVSPTLYGVFMEEISHAFDGGIYAELIQNRSFEEGIPPPGMKLLKKEDGSLKMELQELPPGVPKEKWNMPWPWSMNCGWDPKRELIGWSLAVEGGAQGQMKLTEAHPMNSASARSLELSITPAPSGQGSVALVNSGYWGIPVQAETPYALKFYLRPGTYQGQVTALLQAKDGKELARREFGEVKPGESWQKHTATLQAAGTDREARFVLRFRGRGTLQVDWVSLFPPTYKGRPNGLRPDLAKYLEELKPAFIRYPGGCYVEGLSFESAPDWRKMVCAPEERPGMWGYWQYRSTDGFGYHEFLEFCEDIGAAAMYVAFCGMTVHPENNWPLDKIGPVVQQTLDAIEYALGPVESKWGAVRAKMGHPKPFLLKYVEIGNEHPPALYGDYYARFRQAIKAKYPEVTVVMSMYWSGLNWGAIERAGDANIDIVDEHAYRPSGWARSNFDYFDKYRRKPWKVYLGEYAHHHGNGDWSAAMDDSVFLMMMERNGDLVTMASYAPLFCNVHKKDWGVNLIEYDASRSFAHASYYVQKVFNETRPDVNLATTLRVTPEPDPNRPLMAGKFGLGSWHTASEFKELRVYDAEGKLVLSDDFQDLSHWETPVVGKWQATGGVLRQTDLGASPSMLLLKTPELKTGRVTLKARRADGNEGFLMFFNASGIDRFLFCNYGAAGNHFSAIQDRGVPEGCAFKGGRSTPGPIEKGRWCEISLVVGRDKAEMFLDGKLVSDARMEFLPSLFATAGYDVKRKTVVLKATNYHAQPVRAEIQLDGAEGVAPAGQHIVLRSGKPADENSLDNPRRIVPQEQPLANCGPRFSVVLPPLSVNVLRILETASHGK